MAFFHRSFKQIVVQRCTSYPQTRFQPDASLTMISTIHQPLADIMREFKEFTSREISKGIETVFESRKDWTLELFGEVADPLNGSRITKPGSDHTELLSKTNFTRQKMDYISWRFCRGRDPGEPECCLYSSAMDYFTHGKGYRTINYVGRIRIFEGGLQRATRQ